MMDIEGALFANSDFKTRIVSMTTIPLISKLSIEFDGCKSEVILSEDCDTQLISCMIRVYAYKASEALGGCNLLRKFFAGGKETVIRCEPDISPGVDLDTGKKYYMALTRFSFFDRPGEWSYIESQTGLRVCEGLGNL
jgi:hypothetical protein